MQKYILPLLLLANLTACNYRKENDKSVAQVDQKILYMSEVAAIVPNGSTQEDSILIAGKGHEDYQILGTQKIHFDDREEARKAIHRQMGSR